MSPMSDAGALADLLPVLVLFGPTTLVLLTCRYLNRRDEHQIVSPVTSTTTQ